MAGGTISAERRRQGQIELQRIKEALADRIEELAAELLRGGRRSHCKHFWEASNIACSGKGWSLKVNLDGRHQGLWKDFGLGKGQPGAGGGPIDLIAQVRCGGEIGAAIREAKRWLEGRGWSADPAISAEYDAAVAARKAERDQADAEEREGKRRSAAALWHGAVPIVDTPAFAYLRGRSIDFARLGRVPRSLRYRPDVWCVEAAAHHGRDRAKLPAMIACVVGLDGRQLGVHRTYLDIAGWDFARRDGRVGKARLEDAKLTLGLSLGGHIPLWKGASRAPLRDIPAGTPVYMSEGIEDGLSVAIAKPDARVIAGVAGSKLYAVELPPQMGPLVLIMQNDPDGSSAFETWEAAIKAHQARGREVRTMFPPPGFKDWNDVLMGKRT